MCNRHFATYLAVSPAFVLSWRRFCIDVLLKICLGKRFETMKFNTGFVLCIWGRHHISENRNRSHRDPILFLKSLGNSGILEMLRNDNVPRRIWWWWKVTFCLQLSAQRQNCIPPTTKQANNATKNTGLMNYSGCIVTMFIFVEKVFFVGIFFLWCDLDLVPLSQLLIVS